MVLTKRGILFGLGGAIVIGAPFIAVLPETGQASGQTMTPRELFDAISNGALVLVDVRRPDEWQKTGLALGAVPIDLRRPDFIEAVRRAQGPSDRPVAIICARGVRSSNMAAALSEAGIAPVIDIPEGMLGSFAGPGWIKAGLPTTPWQG